MSNNAKIIMRGLCLLGICLVGVLSPVIWMFTAFYLLYGQSGWWVAPCWIVSGVVLVLSFFVMGISAGFIFYGYKAYKDGMRAEKRKADLAQRWKTRSSPEPTPGAN